MKINLDRIDRLMVQADHALSLLDGRELDDAEAASTKRRDAAKVSRELLHLADTLDAAAALVRQEYWAVKGYNDATKENA
jgi:hypothetical protein